jgi:hypothetical protein
MSKKLLLLFVCLRFGQRGARIQVELQHSFSAGVLVVLQYNRIGIGVILLASY